MHCEILKVIEKNKKSAYSKATMERAWSVAGLCVCPWLGRKIATASSSSKGQISEYSEDAQLSKIQLAGPGVYLAVCLCLSSPPTCSADLPRQMNWRRTGEATNQLLLVHVHRRGNRKLITSTCMMPCITCNLNIALTCSTFRDGRMIRGQNGHLHFPLTNILLRHLSWQLKSVPTFSP